MPSTPSAAVLQVFVFRNGEFVGTDLFTERTVVVGRDPGCDLVLESSSVSRTHALLEHDGRQVFVRDTGSTNGVFVNDHKAEHALVGRLDQVFLGEYSLKVKLVSRPGAVVPGADRDTPVSTPAVGAEGNEDPTHHPKPPASPPPAAATAMAQAPARPLAAEKPLAPEPVAARPAPATPKASAPRPAPEKPAPARPASATPKAVAAKPAPEKPAGKAPEKPAVKAAAPAALQPSPAHTSTPAPAAAHSPRRPPVRDDDDEHDDETPWVPTFSMLEETLAAGAGGTEATHVEVLVTRGGSLSEAVVLGPGEAYDVMGGNPERPRRQRLVKCRKRGECRLELPEEASGTITREGKRHPLAEAGLVRKGKRLVPLSADDSAELAVGPRHLVVRFVSPPAPPSDRRSLRERFRPDRTVTRSLGGSVGGHVMLVLVGLVLPARSVAPPEQTETFAEVVLDKELKLEEPPAPPPPPPAEAPAAPQPKPVPKTLEAAPSPRVKAGGTAKAPPGVLGLLSKVGTSAAPGPAAALAAVSNLSAANTPAGSGGFKVSGLVSNLPTADILVGGGGGGLVTKGGAALLRGGGGGGGLAAGGQGTRTVGGLVQKMPQAMRATGQGSLDRDAIQKVINQNVSQIQRCYERELNSKPGLSGKIEVEWVVTIAGSVKGVRQKFASLDSVTAVNCILDHIRTWQFPQPQGGEVVVSYPFVFKSISF